MKHPYCIYIDIKPMGFIPNEMRIRVPHFRVLSGTVLIDYIDIYLILITL